MSVHHEPATSAARDGQPRPLLFTVVFALLAAVFVGLFVATVPAGFGLDEANHTYRAWQVSRGTLEPETLSPRLQYGGPIPRTLVDYELEGTDAANAGRDHGQPWLRHDIALAPHLTEYGERPVDGPTLTLPFTNAGASSFVAYGPAALGMRLGTMLDLDVHGVVLLGKAVGGFVYVALATLAVMLVRATRWRWLVAVVALLPETVFQASVITADTVSNGITILFAAAVLALLRRTERAPWLLLGGTVAAGLGVIAVKPTYVLLLPLLLTVPAAALGLRRRWAVVAQGGAVLAIGALGAWMSSRVSDIADAIRTQVPDYTTIDEHRQLALLLHDPGHLVSVLARTVAEFGSTWVAGATRLLGTNSVLVPGPFVAALLLVLVLAAFRGDRHRPVVGAVFVAVATATVAAVVLTLYLTFTTVGSEVAVGVQGRYWIPVAVPLLAGLGMLLPIRVQMTERVAAITFTSVSVLTLVAAVWAWCATVY